MNETIDRILKRRTCRNFDTGRQITDKELDMLLQAARYAPSAMNTQSWHFTVIQNPAVLERLNDAVFGCLDTASRERITARCENSKPSFFYGAPTFIIVSLSPETPYPEADAACALENIFLAASSLGIGSCWINQLRNICDKEPLKSFLGEVGVPEGKRVYGCAAIGYPVSEAPLKERKENTVNIIK